MLLRGRLGRLLQEAGHKPAAVVVKVVDACLSTLFVDGQAFSDLSDAAWRAYCRIVAEKQREHEAAALAGDGPRNQECTREQP